jgi:hypothetical protein
MLDQGEQPAAIARAIRTRTGERVAADAIEHYARFYRQRQQKEQEIREGLDEFLARINQDGIQVSDLLRAMLFERFSQARKDGSVADLDLLKLEEADRKRCELELKQQQALSSNRYREWELQIKERKHQLAEKQFEFQRERARANFQELERKAQAGQSLSSDDIRRIREIYGLSEEPQPSIPRSWSAYHETDAQQ